MSRIALQPAGDADASKHYEDTIINPVPIETIKPFVDNKTAERLTVLYPSKLVPTWGVTPGNKNVNVGKWERLESGDITLFARKGEVYASGVVSFKIHNADFAKALWGIKKDTGETWEYIYFLDEIKGHDISYERLNKVAGYAPNYIIQGFNVLDETKSEALISAFDLGSDTYSPPITEADYEESLKQLDEDLLLDKQSLISTRTEQSFLRSFLFRGKKIGQCSICKKPYPVYFLVAAHIKKRAECNDDEKRDYQNIVVPMCKFGCDELYEKGFIGVNEGKVIALKSDKELTEAAKSYLMQIVGNKFDFWNEKTADYFKWHNEAFRNL